MITFNSISTTSIIFLSLRVIISAFPLTNDENSVEETGLDLSYLGDKVFSKPDLETGKKLESWNETSEENPEELGEYAEGDIVFPKRARNGLMATSFRWPDGVVPYEINGAYSTRDIEIINRAMSIYEKYTCIRKQSRAERDDYITVVWQNIKRGHENNFNKAQRDQTNGFGVDYDYRSVMHYSSKAFSANSEPTLIPKDDKFLDKIGQREGFSRGDITKINAMYNCPEKTLEIVNVTGTIPNGTSSSQPDKEKEPDSNPFLSAAAELFSLFIH